MADREGWSLGVLGSPELRDRAGEPVVLAPRVRRLLAALATQADQIVSTDWLVDAVWDEAPPQSPEAALQTLVSRLRRALHRADGLSVTTGPGGYRLVVEAEALDVREWEDLVRRAHQAAGEPRRAAELLARALSLWRGEAYGELGSEHFAQPEAARLSELRVVALEDRAELLLAADDATAALPMLQQLVRQQPFRERPVRLLTLAQYRLGRTAEALTTLQDHRSRLADELGIDPSPELGALQTMVLNNDPALDLDPPAPPSGGSRGAALPRVELIGREEDQRDLAEAVRRCRLVSVTGPGGVGKTSLVAASLDDLSGAYGDGCVVVQLSRLPMGSSVAAALCTALSVPVAGDQDRRAQLIGYLGERHLLLVLDNCEHLVTEVAALVDALLRSCPRLTVLNTSRVPLRLPVEKVFALAPLEVGSADGSAVRLFLTRARQRVRGFDRPEAPDPAVVELCTRLDGLPLALELAASQMDASTPADLLARLGWRLTVLRGGTASDPRHRTLRALVDWSFEALTAPEQELFQVVSVFAGRFTLADVEEVVGRLDLRHLGGPAEALATLTSLVEQSMVIWGRADATYFLLETLRTYGRDRLAHGELAEAAYCAYAEMFAARAAEGYDDLYGAGQVARVDRCERAMDEFRAAYRWALEHDAAVAAELVGGLAALVEHRLVGEVPVWADELLALPGAATPRLARVCAVAAAGARFVGQLERAADLAQRALDLSGEDAAVAAYAYLLLAEADFFTGRLDRARSWRTPLAGLTAARPQLLPILQMVDCTALLATAYAAASPGRASGPGAEGGTTEGGTAEAVAAQAWDIQQRAERRGWSVVAAWALYVRGEVLIDHDPARADGLLQQALERARGLDERYLSGVALVAAASARSRHGSPADAVDQFAEVVQHWRDRGDWTHQWTTLRNVLDLLVRLGRREAAVVLTAALLDQERGAAGYGRDAARLLETAEALAETMDPDRHRELEAQGRSLPDQQVVSFALEALQDKQLNSEELSNAAGRTGRS